MDAQDGRGVWRVYAAVFHAPEPSLRGFIGYVGWLGIVGAGFSLYHRVWLTAVVGLAVAAVAWPVAVWLQCREPTTSFVELPPIAVHYLYPLPMVGTLLLGVAILIGDAALAVVGTVMTALGSVGLWLAFRRRRRFGG